MADENCLFCKIVKGDIPCIKLAETEHALCFMDIMPLSDGHCLIIPKEHAPHLHQISEKAMEEIGPMMTKVARAVNARNYNLLQNNGSLAHQEVMHAHFHIIPKTCAEDGLAIHWPDHPIDKDRLKVLAEAIAERIKEM